MLILSRYIRQLEGRSLFDNDGRIDVVTTALDAPIELWLNRSPEKQHWLLIESTGTTSNRDGMGAKIKVATASGAQYNQVNIAIGYSCASDRRVHFGLGQDAVVKELTITWTSGPNGRCAMLRPIKC
jgi:hypothetical protein